MISAGELARHNTEGDCWASFEGKVYNITQFINEHPGGLKKIMSVAGNDGTSAFNREGHSDNARLVR